MRVRPGWTSIEIKFKSSTEESENDSDSETQFKIYTYSVICIKSRGVENRNQINREMFISIFYVISHLNKQK